MTCEQMFESGAYVLGILDDEDRAAYERHLATCAICQREVADFSDLPGMLAQLDPAEAAAIGHNDVPGAFPGPAVTGTRAPLRPLPSVPRANPVGDDFTSRRTWPSSRVERGAQRRRRRWRAVTAGLAAAACLAVGILVGTRLVDTGPVTPDARMVAMRPVAAGVPISAKVALDPFIGGTEVRMHCVYGGGKTGTPRWTLKMLVYPKSGAAPEQVSTWTAAHGEDVTVAAATQLSPTDISKIEVRKADNTSLLVYENG
jgi:hypothetical protein